MKTKEFNNTTPALNRGLTILEILAATGAPVAFKQLCSELELAATSVSRLLQVLCTRGYVEKDPSTGKYRLGAALQSLQQHGSIVERLRLAGRRVLPQLVKETGNTAVIFLLRGEQTEVLDKKMHPAAVPMQHVGNIGDVNLLAPWGWIFLMQSPEDRCENLLVETDNPDDWRRFLKKKKRELESVGCCYDDLQAPIRRLAAPIYDGASKVVACLALGGNPFTMPDDRLGEIRGILVGRARRLGGKAD